MYTPSKRNSLHPIFRDTGIRYSTVQKVVQVSAKGVSHSMDEDTVGCSEWYIRSASYLIFHGKDSSVPGL